MLNVDLTDNLVGKYTGTLQIHHLDENGNTLKITHAPNTITYDAREVLSYLLAGQTSANKFVKYLHVGTNPQVPSRADVGLISDIPTAAVALTFTFPAVDRVTFEGILPNVSAANGSILQEAGLFNEDGDMFARQVYGVIDKELAIQLKYIWTIIFT